MKEMLTAAQLATVDESALFSGVAALDHLTTQGLKSGTITEWGMPEGRGGRRIILEYIKQVPQCLWIYPAQSAQMIYPPAWAACGVDLSRIRFAACEHVIKDLRPVFFETVFSLIVIDQPHKFSKDDFAFLTTRARAQGQHYFILRPYFLHERLGNVWARYRFNAWFDPFKRSFKTALVRGQRPRTASFVL